MANHVRIDRVAQGPDGAETPADRLHIRYDDFLWIYIDAELPRGAAPKGEYFKVIGGTADPTTRQALSAPTNANGFYRFSLIHYILSPQSVYSFHFADDFANPAYEDRWEIHTL